MSPSSLVYPSSAIRDKDIWLTAIAAEEVTDYHSIDAMWPTGADEFVFGATLGVDEAQQSAHDHQQFPGAIYHVLEDEEPASSFLSQSIRDTGTTTPATDLSAYAFAPHEPPGFSTPRDNMHPTGQHSPYLAPPTSRPAIPQVRTASKKEPKKTTIRAPSKANGVAKPYRHTAGTNVQAIANYDFGTGEIHLSTSASPSHSDISPQLTKSLSDSLGPRSDSLGLAAASLGAEKDSRNDLSTPHVEADGEISAAIRLRTPSECQGGKNLARALGFLGGRTSPIGPGVSGFDITFADLLDARSRHPGQVIVHRNALLDSEDYNSAFEEDARLNRDLCNQAILKSSADTSPEGTYLLDLGGGFQITVPLDPIIEATFKQGGQGTIPPEGLVRIATEMNVDMKDYRVDGKPHPVYSMGAPKQVDIRLLGSIPVTIVEMAIWFPAHGSLWPDWTQRFARSGWTQNNIADLINRAYNTDAVEGVGPSTISQQTNKHGREARELLESSGQGQQQITESAAHPVTSFSCESWTPPGDEYQLVDYYVRDLANGVDRDDFPSGSDRGLLTQLIEFVDDNLDEWADLLLSDVQFIEDSGGYFQTTNPAFGPGMENPDEEAFRRHRLQLKQYRKTMADYRIQQKKDKAKFAIGSQDQA
ncbi:uncharacterized protein J4E78_007079 [Alternaria triticimaculans]|uniref:uncharacterized protein n=1 Tax=Alternaria triticimaculans TaxID=297637 RepID=UPI0020C27257|nr:uncharacterized protein J4E78_007079 [Alternaria triticimaculans]KAI4654900.1 hypothetical protein J4E78_007079 [Alternaria triticimaculans]